MRLFSKKSSLGKIENFINFTGLFDQNKDCLLSKTHYDLLMKFAEKRANSSEGWLEIKPKNENRTTRSYDIKDYNQIKRLLHAIFNVYIGKDIWTKEHHELPLKELLFERSSDRERKIRLAIAPENIDFSD